MKASTEMILKELTARYPALACVEGDVRAAYDTLHDCFAVGGRVYLCGNGGSAADCEHIVGELMKGFLKLRPIEEDAKNEMMKSSPLLDGELLSKLQRGLPAISLPHISALNSAFCNDVDAELIYAQSLFALGKRGDVLIALSTSGNAKNVAASLKVAKALGITVIGLTGAKGGFLRENADVCICAPENETFKIQELHLPIYHYLCAAVEEHFFSK